VTYSLKEKDRSREYTMPAPDLPEQWLGMSSGRRRAWVRDYVRTRLPGGAIIRDVVYEIM
jgi:hypothetical protein